MSTSAALARIYARRAALQRELAELDLELAEVVVAAAPAAQEADAVLSLAEAADFMGEPPSTFRRRPEYLRALLSRPQERRKRYSRAALERIKRERLEANGAS
jgi:hypothetical protein